MTCGGPVETSFSQTMPTHLCSPTPGPSSKAYGSRPTTIRCAGNSRSIPDVAPQRVNIATGTDGVVALDRIGVLHLPAVGNLDVWWLASYGGGVFVPLRDPTAGIETYGGGRYLIDTIKGAGLGGSDRTLIIDLNFAYNPSCAYDPVWACPLPPAGNILPVAVRAGELDFH